jgi:predicted AAA+ superfamily ATPase
MKSVLKVDIDQETVANYISYLEESFLFEGSKRYNVKGNKYYESIKKYYAVDIGLRNAKLNFRQQELNSLLKISDSFRKIVIVGNDIAEYTDDNGIRYMGLFQFLLTD